MLDFTASGFFVFRYLDLLALLLAEPSLADTLEALGGFIILVVLLFMRDFFDLLYLLNIDDSFFEFDWSQLESLR